MKSEIAWAGNTRIVHDEFSLDFKGDTLVLKNGHRHKETVEITGDFELLVNGDKVKTDRKDRKLLKAYLFLF